VPVAVILAVREVTKAFGKMVAVDSVSFEVADGEIYGIAGPNGAGKSTLFNLITRIPFGPDGGTIEFQGSPIHNLPAHIICRRGVARTFQTEAVFDSVSVYDNVRVGAEYGRASQRRADSSVVIKETLEFVGMWPQRDRLARDLAIFEKKRLMLASALATSPALLLLDEPASGLNQSEQEELIELIRRINGSGVSVVLIEHVLPLLLALSNRVLILNEGARLVEGDPDTVISDERVVQAYLGSGATRERPSGS
jgi:branched-chain amino acid transport system ATP-binding protein